MIIEKITEPKTHLECNDLTPSQKKVLFAVMAKYGALQYFAYDRFFKEGFHEWELKGINQIKRDFIDAHRAEIFPDGVDTHLLPTIDEMGFKWAEVHPQLEDNTRGLGIWDVFNSTIHKRRRAWKKTL